MSEFEIEPADCHQREPFAWRLGSVALGEMLTTLHAAGRAAAARWSSRSVASPSLVGVAGNFVSALDNRERRGRDGEAKADSCAAFGAVLGPDAATVRLDKSFGNREAEAGVLAR
jgi:hypothetical protein